MKTLILMRHAKSSWDNPHQADHDRPLNQRGLRNAPEMGERFARHKIQPDTIVTSSAVRAEATARLVMEAAQWTEPLFVRPELYHATSSTWLAVVRELSGESIAAFGHNPGISEFANILTREGLSLSTAAVAIIEVGIDSWSELSFDSDGRLIDLWTPRDDE